MYKRERVSEYFCEPSEEIWNGPFYFIQGADIQFGFISRELDNDTIISWEKEIVLAESIVERINKMNPKPRFFAMCGDLCDAMPDTEPDVRKKQEADYKRIFGKLDKSIPLINVCGNHDVGNTPTPETVKMYQSSFGDDYYSFFCGGVLFLVLNSQYFFDSSKVQFLADEQQNWIDEKLELARNKKLRVVVFQHIPWFLKSIDEENSYFTLNVNLRKKWLDKFKEAGVEAVFCGHYHRNAGGTYNGIDMVVTSAVGGQLGSDLPGEKISDETVEELESLKGIISEEKSGSGRLPTHEEISVSKSQTSSFSDLNGQKSAHKEITNEVNENGKLVAKVSQKIDSLKNKEEVPKSVVKTEIEIPSTGSYFSQRVIKNYENLEATQEKKMENTADSKRARNGIDTINSFSEIKYSPHDMAEYIFWTGDEKGVALTIEEFLQEGLMTRQEAITFLQSIKHNLDLMQAHYQGLGKVDEKNSNKGRANMKRKFLNQNKFDENPKESSYVEKHTGEKLMSTNVVSVKSESPEVVADVKNYMGPKISEKEGSSLQDYSERKNKSYSSVAKNFDDFLVNDDDYDEITERIKVAGFLRKELSLEEVIFELAKIMFSESLTKGNIEAQKAMQKFSDFLQNQVQHNQISRNLQRKIIDILSSALMDALSEHPEMLNSPKGEKIIFDQNLPASEALKHLLMSGAKRLAGQLSSKVELSKKNASFRTEEII